MNVSISDDFAIQQHTFYIVSECVDLPRGWEATTRHKEAEGSSYYRHFHMGLLREDPQVLAFVREFEGERTLCAFNFSDRAARFELPPAIVAQGVLEGSGLQGARLEAQAIEFEPWGGLFAAL